jgi:hypothetical protein
VVYNANSIRPTERSTASMSEAYDDGDAQTTGDKNDACTLGRNVGAHLLPPKEGCDSLFENLNNTVSLDKEDQSPHRLASTGKRIPDDLGQALESSKTSQSGYSCPVTVCGKSFRTKSSLR